MLKSQTKGADESDEETNDFLLKNFLPHIDDVAA